jgi:hypothetical protein
VDFLLRPFCFSGRSRFLGSVGSAGGSCSAGFDWFQFAADHLIGFSIHQRGDEQVIPELPDELLGVAHEISRMARGVFIFRTSGT